MSSNGLDERVAQLERRLRTWRLLTMIALVVAALGVWAEVQEIRGRLAVYEAVTARAFYLVDDSGRVTARLLNSEDGPSLLLTARAPEDMVVVGNTGGGLGLGVLQHGEVRTSLVVGKEGSPKFGMSSLHRGNAQVLLGLDDDGKGSSYLMLRGPQGKSRFVVSVDQKRELLQLRDRDGDDVLFARSPDAGPGDQSSVDAGL